MPRESSSGQVSNWGKSVDLPQSFGYVANGLTMDRLVAGRYYGPGRVSNITFAVAGPFVWAAPFFVSETQTFDRIAIQIITQASAGAVARLGISDMVNGLPTNVIVDGGSIAIDTTGVKETTINQTLSTGWYGLIFAPSASVTPRGSSNGTYLGHSAASSTGGGAIFSQNIDYSAGLPAALSMTARLDLATNGLFIALRAA